MARAIFPCHNCLLSGIKFILNKTSKVIKLENSLDFLKRLRKRSSFAIEGIQNCSMLPIEPILSNFQFVGNHNSVETYAVLVWANALNIVRDFKIFQSVYFLVFVISSQTFFPIQGHIKETYWKRFAARLLRNRSFSIRWAILGIRTCVFQEILLQNRTSLPIYASCWSTSTLSTSRNRFLATTFILSKLSVASTHSKSCLLFISLFLPLSFFVKQKLYNYFYLHNVDYVSGRTLLINFLSLLVPLFEDFLRHIHPHFPTHHS